MGFAMDIQLKKGLLEECVLATLYGEPSYGYRILGDINEVVPMTESTLYPILKRLESAGCLVTYSEAYNGRLRKYYMLTDMGKQKLRDFTDEWSKLKAIYDYIVRRSA